MASRRLTIRPGLPIQILTILAVAAGALEWGASAAHRRVRQHLGLRQLFYTSSDLREPAAVVRRTARVDLSVLEGNRALPRRFFSIRWDGYWDVRAGGAFDIHAGADDFATVWIDGTRVIERSDASGRGSSNATVRLAPGLHRLRIEYAQLGGDAHLNVRWAPAGGSSRPFDATSLFPSEPTVELLEAARFSATLRRAAGWAWTAVRVAGCLALGLLLAPVVQRVAWRETAWWAWVAAQGLTRRTARPATVLAALVATIWTGIVRSGGLDPLTLWADDIWVAALTAIGSFWDAVRVPAPVPPAVVAALWLVRRAFGDLELSLQAIPFLASLLAPLVLGFVVARGFKSRALGLLAVCTALLDPVLAQFSVLVKHYSTDYLISALLLALAIHVFQGARPRLIPVALSGTAALLFSFPSVFLSVSIMHVAAWLACRERWRRGVSAWRPCGTVAGFDLAFLIQYALVLRPRSSPALREFWARDFLPTWSAGQALEFLATRGRAAVEAMLPDFLAVAIPLAGVGLIWLIWSRAWRRLGIVLLASYAGAIAASAMELQPIAGGFAARTTLFSHAITAFLLVSGVHAVTQIVRWRRPLNVMAAASGLVLVFLTPVRITYFDHDHSQLVVTLGRLARPSDAIVLNDRASFLVGVYGEWPVAAVEDRGTNGFHLRILRPTTLTLEPNAEADASRLGPLTTFLDRHRPDRLFFFSARRETLAAETVLGQDLVEVRRWTSTTATRLIEYQRMGTGRADRGR